MDCSPQECRRISEDERSQRRSVQDALEVVRWFPGFEEIASKPGPKIPIARVRICFLKLPSGATPALVDCVFSVLGAIVSLPTAEHFHAYCIEERHCLRFRIEELHDAAVMTDGTVVLPSGKRLRGVVIRPAHVARTTTETSYRKSLRGCAR